MISNSKIEIQNRENKSEKQLNVLKKWCDSNEKRKQAENCIKRNEILSFSSLLYFNKNCSRLHARVYVCVKPKRCFSFFFWKIQENPLLSWKNLQNLVLKIKIFNFYRSIAILLDYFVQHVNLAPIMNVFGLQTSVL